MSEGTRDLGRYSVAGFDRGAPRWKEAFWVLARALFFHGAIPWPSGLRAAILRLFGANIGRGAVIRCGVHVTFPWRLRLGDNVWLGEQVMVLNLAEIVVESNVCVSQRVFLCAGSHDHRSPTFELITRPITLREGCWIAAQAFVGPGVEIGAGAVLGAGSVAVENVPPGVVACGNPARPTGKPTLNTRCGS